jgi:phenylacetate-CoA ligase
MRNWKKLSHLSRRKARNIQNKKLKGLIRHKIAFSPYYRNLFRQNGVKFSSIRTAKDLEKIPLTSKQDIAPDKKNPKRYADFIMKPDKGLIKAYSTKVDLLRYRINNSASYEFRPVHVHFTTGRTANAVPFLYTGHDLDRLREAGRRMMEIIGIKSNERLVNAFPYAPHLAFWQTFFAAEGAGVFAIHSGGGKILGTDKIINVVEDLKASLLAFMPGYAYHLLRVANEKKADFSSVKKVFFGGERVPEGLREKIKSILKSLGSSNPEVFSTYAFTEGKVAWVECKENNGYHLYPDMEFIEILDFKGERVGEGERGEIVYTGLDFRGSAVLRYKTGDIGSLTYEKCSCGRTVPRLNSDIERVSEIREINLKKIKGVLVNLNSFFDLLHKREIEEWQVEIRKRNNDPYEVDELVIYIAPKKKVNFNKLREGLRNSIWKNLEITPEIVKVDLKELLRRLGMETELKEKRIVDSRFTSRAKRP